MMAHISTRPGAPSLIESSYYHSTNDSLYWKNTKLKLIKSSLNDIFVTESETLIKEKRKMAEQILIDVPTNPVFSLILLLTELAFADDVFANEGIQRAADLFRLRVEDPGKNNLEVPWKASILGTPIFRSWAVERGKSYTSKTISREYTDFDFHLKRLGIFAGFPDGVRSCYLRRGAANAIDNPEVTCRPIPSGQITRSRDQRVPVALLSVFLVSWVLWKCVVSSLPFFNSAFCLFFCLLCFCT